LVPVPEFRLAFPDPDAAVIELRGNRTSQMGESYLGI